MTTITIPLSFQPSPRDELTWTSPSDQASVPDPRSLCWVATTPTTSHEALATSSCRPNLPSLHHEAQTMDPIVVTSTSSISHRALSSASPGVPCDHCSYRISPSSSHNHRVYLSSKTPIEVVPRVEVKRPSRYGGCVSDLRLSREKTVVIGGYWPKTVAVVDGDSGRWWFGGWQWLK
ncbi:hypothetical protein NL676_031889 [Syzygium grande]|nr:hypothetical protein NL676_031889 [Syzygium grande]